MSDIESPAVLVLHAAADVIEAERFKVDAEITEQAHRDELSALSWGCTDVMGAIWTAHYGELLAQSQQVGNTLAFCGCALFTTLAAVRATKAFLRYTR